MTTVVQYTRFGGPEVLEISEIPTPTPPDDGVVVDVRAAGVNQIDSKMRSGLRPTGPIVEPRRVGSDASGVISAIGSSVTGWKVGDGVIVLGAHGAYATQLVASTGQLVAKPQSLTWEQAAAIGIPVSTAYQALKSLGVGERMTLLIHGGSGGVGQAAIQFARAWGATVIATASQPNHARLAALGATPVLYGPGLVGRLRAASPNGFDAALDAIGTAEALGASLELVIDRSRIGTIVMGARAADLGIRAWAGGSPVPLSAQEQQWRRESIAVVAGMVDRGEFEVEVSKVYALREAAEAQRASEGGHVRGKIVLVP